MDKKKIMDKVAKLLALSQGTNHSPEADSARERASDLMAKYDIKAIEQPKPYGEQTQQLKRIKPIKYDSMLIDIVCRFNGVCLVTQEGYGSIKGAFIYVGMEVDIVASRYMVDILTAQRSSAWRSYREEKKGEGYSLKQKHQIQWYQGYALGVRDKMAELTRLKEAKVQEYGLVPVNHREQALREYKENNNVKEEKQKGVSYNSDGREAGRNAHIHKGVEDKSSVALIE